VSAKEFHSKKHCSAQVYSCILLIVLTIITAIYLFPFIWLVLSSIKSDIEQYSIPPVLFPSKPTLENYVNVDLKALQNSLIVAFSSTGITMLLGTLAGYAIARYRIHVIIPLLVLVTRMLPPAALFLPIFLVMKDLNLIDTLLSLIICHVGLQLPLGIWAMRSFFATLPREFEEAAKIDGCSTFGALFRIILPMSAPGLAATAILVFQTSWIDLLFPLILTRAEAKTMPLVIAENVTAFVIKWGPMTAFSVVYTIPAMIFIALAQRYIVRGLTLGAIKG